MSYSNPTAIHIRSVSGSVVTYRRDDGTTDIPLDVSQILSYSPWWFVSQNMGIADRFQADNALYTVGAIVAKNFAGQAWSAVQLNATVMGVTINALFDQVTGLALYWYHTDGSSYENEFIITSLEVETEAPVTPIDPAWIVVMALAGIGISVLVASRKMVIRSASE